jgi:hypothetical protein
MKYVVQHHITVNPHFDLMIDNGESLDTWQVHEGDMDRLISGKTITAESIEPHRRDYLEYEGPVSQGRGRVEIYDTGEYSDIIREKTHLSLLLKGERLRGKMEIRETAGKSWEIFLET